ncbi:MAG: glucuronate isomerase [Candidatus Acidiferrales bacterium]
MAFIHEDFLLQSKAARRLYHTYAESQPIFDFHCHLSPREIAENRRFGNLTEICLEGDHYKWRAMRANGIDERYCTGDAEPYDKFLAWAKTVPYTLRNSLYHWTHLELGRYFEVFELLNEESAPAIWERANERLRSGNLTARGILEKFGVAAVCTTEDPVTSLDFHDRIEQSSLSTRVFPAFRPDKALQTRDPAAFNEWTNKLGASANLEISRLADFLDALRKRHDYFHQHGCRLSDHGLDYCYAETCGDREAEGIFSKVRAGTQLSPAETSKLGGFLMMFFGRLDAQRGWTKQLHLGALRNTNTRMLESLGRDTGFDSIGDWPQAAALSAYLDRLDRENLLPRVIVFNANPADNYVFATMAGNFQTGRAPGKIQFGSGWWFLDQKEGIELQLNALSNCGLLSRFVGMITDSRSFMSFPRHEYFRRVLCNLLGDEVEKGLLPDDEELIGATIKNICFENAYAYFGLDVPLGPKPPAIVTSK